MRGDLVVAMASDVSVGWECKYRRLNSTDEVAENPTLLVKNLKYGDSLVWGDVCFRDKTGKILIASPFVARFVVREKDQARGLLLLNRYEGSVFLQKT